jgi:hypothetical protein
VVIVTYGNYVGGVQRPHERAGQVTGFVGPNDAGEPDIVRVLL